MSSAGSGRGGEIAVAACITRATMASTEDCALCASASVDLPPALSEVEPLLSKSESRQARVGNDSAAVAGAPGTSLPAAAPAVAQACSAAPLVAAAAVHASAVPAVFSEGARSMIGNGGSDDAGNGRERNAAGLPGGAGIAPGECPAGVDFIRLGNMTEGTSSSAGGASRRGDEWTRLTLGDTWLTHEILFSCASSARLAFDWDVGRSGRSPCTQSVLNTALTDGEALRTRLEDSTESS